VRLQRSPFKLSAPPLALAVLALAGCGSSSSSTSSTASTPARAPATPATQTAATAPATTTPASGGTSAPQTLAVAAGPGAELKFSPASLTAKAGAATISFSNGTPLGHNFTLADSSGTVVGATPTFQGATKPLSVTLKAGTYKFYCTVPGHRQAGMEGTLTVQ
jgi:plastocyanin